MGIVAERICVWCLVIITISTGFGQAEVKKVWRRLKKSSVGGGDATHKWGALLIGKENNTAVL